jgi:hypothetical protein
MFIGPETRSIMRTRVAANYLTDTNLGNVLGTILPVTASVV